MAIHTYIGARYVPKFIGTYDPTQSYEALDVVDNGSGTSYIAVKPTPAGTPLTDTTHWFLYGAASGAIINLQNQINQINSDIQDIVNRYDVLIPEDYGAEGDGITSDLQAFKDCFADAAGKCVLLTRTYLIDGTNIDVPSNCTIIGAGGVVLDAAHTQDDNVRTGIFCIHNVSGVKIQNVTFKGISLGEIKTSSYYTNTLIDIADSSDIEISNNKLLAIDSNHGIVIKHGTNVRVINNYISWYRYIGIGTLNNSKNVLIQGNLIYNCGFNYVNTYPIGVSSIEHSGALADQIVCENVTCDGNIIYCDVGNNDWEGIDAHGGKKLNVTNNILYNIRYGIALMSEIARNFQVDDSIISGNIYYNDDANSYSGGSYGISIGGERNLVTDNYIYGAGKSGVGAIYLNNWIRASKITDNLIVAYFTAAIAYGAYNDTNLSRDIVISDNMFVAGQGATAHIFNTENNNGATVYFGRDFIMRNNEFVRAGGVNPTYNLPNAAHYEPLILEGNYYPTTPTYAGDLRNVAPDLIDIADISSYTAGGHVGHTCIIAGGGATDPIMMVFNGSAYRKINASS